MSVPGARSSALVVVCPTQVLPVNVAENLSLPRRWKRLPKALTDREISQLLVAETPETPASLQHSRLAAAFALGSEIIRLRRIAQRTALPKPLDAALQAIAHGVSETGQLDAVGAHDPDAAKLQTLGQV